MIHLLICIRKCILHTLKIHSINNKQKNRRIFNNPFSLNSSQGLAIFKSGLKNTKKVVVLNIKLKVDFDLRACYEHNPKSFWQAQSHC